MADIITNLPDLGENTTSYSIRSCFRTGDENPFTGQNKPNVVIKYNNIVTQAETPFTINSHDITLQADYWQDRFIQWRTYKWVLTSESGLDVYSQTPVQYDNDIKVSFYGLKGDTTYKIILILETNDNREFSFERIVKVDTGTLSKANWLTAEADNSGYYTDSEAGDRGSNSVIINTNGRFGNLYKCEIWPTGQQEEPVYHLVGENVGPIINDYNVANHRWYKYVFRSEGSDYVIPVQTSWAGWTITELLPTKPYGHLLSYTTNSTGVWKFKYNVSAGSQTQNLSKASHDTLGRFPYFSFGRTNYESGSVTCLLGREMIPYDISPNRSQYVYKDGQWQWEYVDSYGLPDQSNMSHLRGGYMERLPNNQDGFRNLGSNEKLNMLNQWKQFCSSGNPKLLKDEKGNAYIVQILNTSSETQNNLYGRPEQISFEWHQIADVKDCVISDGQPDEVSGYYVGVSYSCEESSIPGLTGIYTKADGTKGNLDLCSVGLIKGIVQLQLNNSNSILYFNMYYKNASGSHTIEIPPNSSVVFRLASNTIITGIYKHAFVFDVAPGEYAEQAYWELVPRVGESIDVGVTPTTTVCYPNIKKFIMTNTSGENLYVYYTLDGISTHQKVEGQTWEFDFTGLITITAIEYAT